MRLEYDKRNQSRDSSCSCSFSRSCSCCIQTQQRQYTTIAPPAHNHLQSPTSDWFHHSSPLSRQQCRDKSDVTTPEGGAIGIASGGETETSDEPSIPGAQKGGRKLAIVFTCTVCDTRSIKQFTENAYNNGVVIVQCPGCQNRHLIADNLSFFEDGEGGWNIEKAMSKMGENVKMVNNDNVMELSVEDLCGAEKIRKLTDTGGASDGKP
jgi:protein import protein ZIM17